MKTVRFIKKEIHGLHIGHAVAKNSSGRPPLLLIHGMWGNWRQFIRWIVPLCESGRDVFVLNLRGHRKGENVSRLTLLDYLEDLKKVLDEIGRVVIIGHSMGGLLAQKLAEDPRILGVVMICSGPPRGILLRGKVLWRAWKYLPSMLTGRGFIASRKDMFDLMLNRVSRKIQAYKDLVNESGRAALGVVLGSISVKPLLVPALVIAGSEDKLLPIAIEKAIAKKHSAPLKVFECGHVPMLEQSAPQVVEEILRWLDKI